MTYGLQTFDIEGNTIVDSELPAFMVDGVYRMNNGTPQQQFSSSTVCHVPFDVFNPTTRFTNAEAVILPVSTSAYHVFFMEDRLAALNIPLTNTLIAVRVLPGNVAFYRSGSPAKNRALYGIYNTIDFAIIRQANNMTPPSTPLNYGAVAYDSDGNQTWSSSWITLGIKGPLGTHTTDSSDWFILSNGQILRNKVSPSYGYRASVGVRRLNSTSYDVRYGFFALSGTNPANDWNASTQASHGFVLQGSDYLNNVNPVLI